jgi:hypothetical protein
MANKAMSCRTACQRTIELKLLDRQFARVPKGQNDAILVCLTFNQSDRTSDGSPRLVKEGADHESN